MRFKDRMGVAWRVLRGSGIKSVVTTTSEVGWSSATYSNTNFESLVAHGWRKNELIYACVHKAANTASQVGLLVAKDGQSPGNPNAPLKKLIQQPNPYMNESDFWYSVIAYQKLAGKACFEKERSRSGQVVRLWPLRPDWCMPVMAGRNKIGWYEYRVPGMQPEVLAAEDVLEFRMWDPIDPFNPWPPVAVAARVGDVDNAVTDYVKMFFEQGGVPPLVLTSKQQLLDDQVDDIRRRWRERYGGSEHWNEPAVLDSEATVTKVGLSFEEMGFGVLDARDEARICMVLDVPPILVGAKVGLDRATYSNYVEAERSWWQDSLMPIYANLLDVVENQLGSEFGGNASVRWDYSNVWSFQEERTAKWTRAGAALRDGGITVNEFRREVGMEDIGRAGEVFLRAMNYEAVGKGELPGEEDEEDVVEDEEGKSTPPSVPPQIEDHNLEREGEEKGVRERQERQIRRAMEGYLRGQLGRVVEDVKPGKKLMAGSGDVSDVG